jgi:hypothetical protein
MERLTPEQRRHRRARAAANRRHHPAQPEPAADDQRTLKADRLERHIREMVDSWPPLTAEQRSRLTLLLHSGSAP